MLCWIDLFNIHVMLGLKIIDMFTKQVGFESTYSQILMTRHDTNLTHKHELPPLLSHDKFNHFKSLLHKELTILKLTTYKCQINGVKTIMFN